MRQNLSCVMSSKPPFLCRLKMMLLRLLKLSVGLAGGCILLTRSRKSCPWTKLPWPIVKNSWLSAVFSFVILGEQALYHVPPLSEVQAKILSRLDFSAEIDTQLAVGFPKPAGKLTELRASRCNFTKSQLY